MIIIFDNDNVYFAWQTRVKNVLCSRNMLTATLTHGMLQWNVSMKVHRGALTPFFRLGSAIELADIAMSLLILFDHTNEVI